MTSSNEQDVAATNGGITGMTISSGEEQQCILMSDKELTALHQYGKSITKRVKPLSLSVGDVQSSILALMDEILLGCTALEIANEDNEDEIVRKTICSQRIGRFPFASMTSTTTKTCLDDLVVDPSILTLAAQALFSRKKESPSKDSWFGYPRLIEAHLVASDITLPPHPATIADKMTYDNALDAVVLTISFPPLSSDVNVELTRMDRFSSTSSPNICHFYSKTSLSSSRSTTTTSLLQIIFATSLVGRSDYGGGSYIRYIAGNRWLANLSPFQKASLGFPPPGHWYWDQKCTLDQVAARYSEFGFDPAPYNDRDHHNDNIFGNDVVCINNDGVSCDPNKTYLDPSRLIHPEPLVLLLGQQKQRHISTADILRDDNDGTLKALSAEQIDFFRNVGYLFLENVLPQDVIENAVHAANELWPEDTTSKNMSSTSPRSFSFPFADKRLNEITLHPQLLEIMCQLLCIPISELRLTQSACFPKRGFDIIDDDTTTGVQHWGNQPMHLDFGNNSLLTPSRSKFTWRDPEEVQGILYYTDHIQTSGGTAVVPGLDHTGIDSKHGGWLPDEYGGDDPRPSLYAMERKVANKVGSILLFQLGTWHRGTPVIPGRTRRIHHLCFHKAEAAWIGSAPEFGQPTISSCSNLHHHLSSPIHEKVLGFSVANIL